MYRVQNKPDGIKADGKCDECDSKSLLYSRGKVLCTNCGYLIGKTNKPNKYGAKRTEFNGKMYDSMFEAETAQSLELRKRAKDIKDYDIQYQIEAKAYRRVGSEFAWHFEEAITVRHKVDFRIHHNDGSYELYEAKGIETDDYKWRRKFIENVFLPLNPDHIYTVVKQNSNYKRRKQ